MAERGSNGRMFRSEREAAVTASEREAAVTASEREAAVTASEREAAVTASGLEFGRVRTWGVGAMSYYITCFYVRPCNFRSGFIKLSCILYHHHHK